MPNKENVKAIPDLPRPRCKKDLRRFVGMLKYLSRFSPNFPFTLNTCANFEGGHGLAMVT